MKRQVTIKDAITMLVPLFIMIVVWAINVHTRVSANEIATKINETSIVKNAKDNEKTRDLVDENYKIIDSKLDVILLRLGAKKDK